MSALKNLGSGSGYIYVVDGGNDIISNLANTLENKNLILLDASVNGALANDSGSNYGGNYKKYYINASASAVSGTLAGATDITNYVTGFSLGNAMPFSSVTVSSGTLSYARHSSIQRIVVDTESAAETDDVVYIKETDNYPVDGDILIIIGKSSSRVTSFIDSTKNAGEDASRAIGGVALSGYGQLELDSNTKFDTLDNNYSLMLMYSTTTTKWHEVNRTPSAVVNREKIKDSGIPLSVSGSKVIESIVGGENINVNTDVTQGVILVTGTHSIGSSNYTINKPTGGKPLEGEMFTVEWTADLTTTGTVSIFGKSIDKNTVSSGSTKPFSVVTKYLNGVWSTGRVSRDEAALESALGNPSSDGMILSSTAAGVRSWVKSEKVVNTVSATYDAATMAKAVGDTPVVIATDAFPKGALIMCDEAIIEMETALTSGGSADVSVGVNGGGISQDVDAIHNVTDFDAAPFSSATSVTRTSPGGSVTILKPASGTCNIEVNVTTADLTGGKFTVTVPYMTS
tara:strand:- start:3667 stop:5208 length:1542 start_codon:yes stop_codon:yes gene_type:complete